MEAMGIHPMIIRWVEGLLKNRSFRVKLGKHLSSEGILKIDVQGSVLARVRFLMCNNVLTCNHLFFEDDEKLAFLSEEAEGK